MKNEPLSYRRVLSQAESESVRSRLQERWNIVEHFWYPLAECPLVEIAAFQDRYFLEFLSSLRLQELMASHGVTRVWELREYGPDYEVDVSLFDPVYDGAEGYWSAGDLDWIVYASHESSITVGGWLLGEVRKHWPQWSRRIWESPFFD